MSAMPASRIDPREFLKRLPLFENLSEQELSTIGAATTELRVARGACIVQRGDPSHGFHIVIFGQVKLGFLSAQGNEKIVEIIGPGHSFGEALMFMDKPYIVNAHALADSMLLHVAKDAVLGQLESNPTFARRMLAGMARRLHGLISDVEAYSLRSASQRVIGYLLKDDPPDGAEVLLSVSKKLIASRLNITPEYLSRVLHELAEMGMIRVSGRYITILNREALRRYDD
jgi:CRP-like cAMP-binding protein